MKWAAPALAAIFGIDGVPPVDLEAVAAELLAELGPGTLAANRTLGVTDRTSFHLFATNRTETCHYHPGDTISTVIQGSGRFYTTNAPLDQPEGSVFFVPEGAAHAFGH